MYFQKKTGEDAIWTGHVDDDLDERLNRVPMEFSFGSMAHARSGSDGLAYPHSVVTYAPHSPNEMSVLLQNFLLCFDTAPTH